MTLPQPNQGPLRIPRGNLAGKARSESLSLVVYEGGSVSNRVAEGASSSRPPQQKRPRCTGYARGSVARALWLLQEYEQYRESSPATRERLWLGWSKEDRRYVHCASTKYQEEQYACHRAPVEAEIRS